MDSTSPQATEIPVSQLKQSQSPLRRMSFLKAKLTLIIIIIFLLGIIATGSYVLGTTETVNQSASFPEKLTALILPDSTDTWVTFTNRDYGYSIKHPKGMKIRGDTLASEELTFGDYMTISVYEQASPCTDCVAEEITKTEDVTINDIQGKKVTGVLKPDEEQDGYYEVPQRFIRYEFTNDSLLYHFAIYELPVETYNEYFVKRDYPLDRKIGDVPKQELKLFEQMIETLQFTKPDRTLLENTADLENVQAIPSPNPAFASGSAGVMAMIPDSLLQAENVKRRADVTALLNAVGQYLAEHEGSTSALSLLMHDTPRQISSPTFTTFCSLLVPAYLPALPTDPRMAQSKTGITRDMCDSKWGLGYTISMSDTEVITVSAPYAALDEKISVSR